MQWLFDLHLHHFLSTALAEIITAKYYLVYQELSC